MSWLAKILLVLLKFSLSRLLPDSNFVIWAFDTKRKQVKTSIMLTYEKDGSFSHKIIATKNREERRLKR